MTTTDTLLVTGASGHLGKLVLDALLANGVKNVIATTRDVTKLADYSARGVAVRAADFAKPETLKVGFQGATRLLLISTDAIGSRVAQHKAAIDAAVKAGVKHIIYTSWPNANSSPAAVSPDHFETENAIIASGLSYTILRNFSYAENLLLSLPTAIAIGGLYGTAGDGRVAYVTRQDCAQAAAAALTATTTKNEILVFTGPRAVSDQKLVAIVCDVIGKPLP